jgi:hypothetical protein
MTEPNELTLERICAIGNNVLDNYALFAVVSEQQRTEPVHETHPGDFITEQIVRAVTVRVLERLAALSPGTWTTAPQTLTIGGVRQQAIYKGNIALSFRLQFDGSKLQTQLHVGGYIIADDRALAPGGQ